MPNSMNSTDKLPPFPEGWYFVTSRSSLQKQKLIRKTWLGEEIVAWCLPGGGVADGCHSGACRMIRPSGRSGAKWACTQFSSRVILRKQ